MDMTLLNALSADQKSEYLTVIRTLEEPGWDIIAKHFSTKAQELLAAGANAGTWDENRIIFGFRLAYEEVANLRDAVEAQFEQLANEALSQTQTQDEESFE